MHYTGKQWHDNKTPFRPRSNQSSFEKRTAERKALAAVKAKEKEMKDEKEAERQVRFKKPCELLILMPPSDESTRSARSALLRRSANASRRWRRRCTRSVSSA